MNLEDIVDSIVSEAEAREAVDMTHAHTNKTTLDSLDTDSDGHLVFNGKRETPDLSDTISGDAGNSLVIGSDEKLYVSEKVAAPVHSEFVGLSYNESGHTGFATSAQGGKADTAYQKPPNGIPVTDMADDVMFFLEKASGAVQVTELIDAIAEHDDDIAAHPDLRNQIPTDYAKLPDIDNAVNAHNSDSAAHGYIESKLNNIENTLDGKQDKLDIVTEIGGDSTDQEIGTAKSVFDLITETIADVERITMIIVTALPPIGETNVIYLIKVDDRYSMHAWISNDWADLGCWQVDLTSKQDKLVSGSNIKTVNGESILGSGNLDVGIDDPSELISTEDDNILKQGEDGMLYISKEDIIETILEILFIGNFGG